MFVTSWLLIQVAVSVEDPLSLPAWLDTLVITLLALGFPLVLLLAFSQSCAVSVAYAVKHPERVSCMVFFGGFLRNFRPQEEIDATASLIGQSWGLANPATRQLFTSVLFPDSTKEEFESFNELQRRAIDPQTAARLFRAAHSIDVRDQARQVDVPTLVMHSRDEPGVPLELGREAAALIPDARFVMLDSKNHLLFEREPAYRQFIDETVAFIEASSPRY